MLKIWYAPNQIDKLFCHKHMHLPVLLSVSLEFIPYHIESRQHLRWMIRGSLSSYLDLFVCDKYKPNADCEEPL